VRLLKPRSIVHNFVSTLRADSMLAADGVDIAGARPST